MSDETAIGKLRHYERLATETVLAAREGAARFSHTATSQSTKGGALEATIATAQVYATLAAAWGPAAAEEAAYMRAESQAQQLLEGIEAGYHPGWQEVVEGGGES